MHDPDKPHCLPCPYKFPLERDRCDFLKNEAVEARRKFWEEFTTVDPPNMFSSPKPWEVPR